MLSSGQLIEEGHNVEPRVLQQPEPQGCGVEERPRLGAAMHSAPGLVPSCPPLHPVCSCHTLTRVFKFLHIPAILEVLAQVASGE